MFLNEVKTDTCNYNTLDSLYRLGKVGRIIPFKTNRSIDENKFNPLVSIDHFIYLEKEYFPDDDKKVILKLDDYGVLIDSLIINKRSAIVNDHIVEKDIFYSWLLDGNKNEKKLENINYFTKSDSLKLKTFIRSVTNNNSEIRFYEPYGISRRMDTCNYIFTIEKNKLEKHNFSSKINVTDFDVSKLNARRLPKFSNKFRKINKVSTDSLIKTNNFFVNTISTYIEGNKLNGSSFHSPTGNSVTIKSGSRYYEGTAFYTLNTGDSLKFKKNNETMNVKKNLDSLVNLYETYADEDLNFYFLKELYYTSNIYIIRK